MQSKNAPPIQFIPVFECAARHLSFKLAANELSVTAPAVAQQVKAFEQWLGRPLFFRHTRALSLTEEGEFYYKVAQETVRIHRRGYVEYVRSFEKKSLTISAPYFVAQELLMPHYLRFSDYCPNTELRIETRMSYVDFESESTDAAVRFGDGNWPELNKQLLAKATVAPVFGPSYEYKNDFSDLSQLHQHRLIYADPEMRDWGPLFWPENTKQRFDNIICDSYIATVNAAADGLGVALGIFPTLNVWVNSERLLMPFAEQIEIDKGFWLVSPKDNQASKQLEGLFNWVESIFDAIPALNEY